MTKKLIRIPLTAKQLDTADWLMGCPLFDNANTAESLAYEWDTTPERAFEIIVAVAQCRIDGKFLVLAPDIDVLEYLVGYAEQATDMAGNEYFCQLLDTFNHQQAQCKSNAAVASAIALTDKLNAAKLTLETN